MKYKVILALKRASSVLMAVLLVVCLVGTPKAGAVVLEGSYLGSVFGTVLSSLGYSWASDNMGNSQFGEAIYSLMTDWASEKSDDVQSYLDTLADLFSTGLVVAGQGKLQLSYNIMNLARDFAEWFQTKFFSSDNTSAVVASDLTVTLLSGQVVSVTTFDTSYPANGSWTSAVASVGTPIMTYGVSEYDASIISGRSGRFWAVGNDLYGIDHSREQEMLLTRSWGSSVTGLYLAYINGGIYPALYGPSNGWSCNASTAYFAVALSVSVDGSSLTAEKPQEVHYPVVAEDGSQVYEITVDGVTATDIEGIIQGAVDRILAGTASIVGSVEQAGTAGEVVNPEIDPYKVSLSSVFPFCIPFDVYNMVTMFVAEPEAPHAECTFTLPWSNQDYSVGWDLSDFDGVAQVCRSMELVLFAVGLAVITHKFIKW